MLIVKSIWAVFTALIMAITMITSPVAVSTDKLELISTDTFVLDKALTMGQGITTDGKYYYTSGCLAPIYVTVIAKYKVDTFEQVAVNKSALPINLLKRGDNHIGGISYYNGMIYASTESDKDDGDKSPCIVVFDADTLEYTGKYYDLPNELFPDGVPWCAVNPKTGYLYASRWTKATTIYVYDINNGMSLVKEINLTGDGVIDRIQGGEFFENELYLSSDCHEDQKKKILKVDIDNGNVCTAYIREVGGDKVETEDLTIFPAADGSLFHVTDYNKAVGLIVHHYRIK